MSDVTPLHPESNPADNSASTPEDPFDQYLDAESDEDFGYVVTRERAAGPDGRPVKLAEWSAQDFSSIYTRFRPHLDRHARRFLNNPSQVDEVVQDAFLYLMVSLPELDSEIGVLRFLKWKTRLLCLDVIRASGKAYIASIDDVAEPVSQDPEISSYLEQQDDAAVLRLALSKLNPRHREVLLASIYEEKTTDQIAAQVGLSENATRQLIFRARSAFKKALLGDDIDTDGMSAAAILSVAARKAAHDAKRVGAQAMVFALFLMLAVGAFIQVGGRNAGEQNLAEVENPAVTTPGNQASNGSGVNTGTQTSEPQTSESAGPTPESTAGPVTQPVPVIIPVVYPEVPSVEVSPTPAVSESPFNPWALDEIFEAAPESVELIRFGSASTLASGVYVPYLVASSQQVVASFDFNSSSVNAFKNVVFTIEVEGKQYTAYAAKSDFYVVSDTNNQERYLYTGQIDSVFDSSGTYVTGTALSDASVQLELVVDSDLVTVLDQRLALLPNY